MEKLEKKSLKEKKAYITWEENDMGSSSDSKKRYNGTGHSKCNSSTKQTLDATN